MAETRQCCFNDGRRCKRCTGTKESRHRCGNGYNRNGVSKDASSMILADDNFATIIKAVANGRNVYRNIKNAIMFLLSGNMAGILCVLYASIVGLSMPFTAIHLLFINLLTDSLPSNSNRNGAFR